MFLNSLTILQGTMRLRLLCVLLFMVGADRCRCQDSVSLHKVDSVSYDVDSMRTRHAAHDTLGLRNDTAWADGHDETAKRLSPIDIALRQEASWAGIPWVAAGLAIQRDRKSVRSLRNKFQYNFHNTTDNYSQYAPFGLTTALKLAGVKGRSGMGRYAVSSALSFAVMATLVNSMKYSARELRPDGTTRNSFPSGHTATAFAAATILHKEYGLTRSPWYSLIGYTLATATGCMRVLNNRHWVSDTFAGAGLGILSTELGYTMADLLFKNRGLQLPYRLNSTDLIRHPSFFNVQMGLGVGSQSLDLTKDNPDLQEYYEDVNVRKLRLSKATVVGVEGAWFFNPYVGIGGRMRGVCRKVRNWNDFTQSPFTDLALFAPQLKGFMDSYTLHVMSDQLSEFSVSGGAYFSYPFSASMALGTKLLIGRNYLRGLDINAEVKGRQRDIDVSVEADGHRRILAYEVLGDVSANGKPYSATWNFLSVEGNRTFCFGTGLSLTFAHRSMMAWKMFVDYDFTRRSYTVRHTPAAFIREAARKLTFEGEPVTHPDKYIQTNIYKQRKSISSLVVGGAFVITL